MQIVSQRLTAPPVDVLGLLVQARFFDEGHCYDQAIAAYERILRMPFFERKAIQNEARLRLAMACVNAGRAQEAIRWTELALRQESSRSGRCLLHETAGKAHEMLGQADQEGHHRRRADELAKAANEPEWLADSLA